MVIPYPLIAPSIVTKNNIAHAYWSPHRNKLKLPAKNCLRPSSTPWPKISSAHPPAAKLSPVLQQTAPSPLCPQNLLQKICSAQCFRKPPPSPNSAFSAQPLYKYLQWPLLLLAACWMLLGIYHSAKLLLNKYRNSQIDSRCLEKGLQPQIILDTVK